jgi:hypothetical protein
LSQEDNNFHMDGVDATGINHQFEKEDLRLRIPVEAIAEIKMSSAAYGADQGGSAGGQIEIVTKSGTKYVSRFGLEICAQQHVRCAAVGFGRAASAPVE